MKKITVAALTIVAIALVVVVVYIRISPISEKEQACINSGGSVRTFLCCKSTGDFPNLCLIGPCGCSPENSHEVKICDCGEGKCFDGNKCVQVERSQDLTCVTKTGKSMSLNVAKLIAIDSECGEKGTLKDTHICNSDTGTWWIDLDVYDEVWEELKVTKEMCNPACVINIETEEASINWRCTGLIG